MSQCVSVVIAARNEPYLRQTVDDLLRNAAGEVEILIGLDGPPHDFEHADKRVSVFKFPQVGLKPVVNNLAAVAHGEWLLKTDAHCSFSPGWDQAMASRMRPNWLMIPRFYVLNAESWSWQDNRFYDYFYLDCPLTDRQGYRFKAGGHWASRTYDRLAITPVDETMSIHGSCWMVNRDFFLNELGGMTIEGYGASYMEPADMANRYWLGPWGGKVMVNKDAWYAHWHQRGDRRGYPLNWPAIRASYLWTAEHWMMNQWPRKFYTFGWLVDRFWPIPTWPNNWRELQREYEVKRLTQA